MLYSNVIKVFSRMNRICKLNDIQELRIVFPVAVDPMPSHSYIAFIIAG
jgi:hypothetical protein